MKGLETRLKRLEMWVEMRWRQGQASLSGSLGEEEWWEGHSWCGKWNQDLPCFLTLVLSLPLPLPTPPILTRTHTFEESFKWSLQVWELLAKSLYKVSNWGCSLLGQWIPCKYRIVERQNDMEGAIPLFVETLNGVPGQICSLHFLIHRSECRVVMRAK